MTRIGSLCTGYGGLDMAAQSVLGGETVWVSDIDKGANKLLAHRYPDVPNLGDFTRTDWSTVEPVDVLTAGFPCQPVSHAGKRQGDLDERWLWDDVARAVRDLRPGLVLLENVRGLLTAGSGRLFGRVLGSLAELGYDASWHGLRAADVGAPHGRWRVFIAATDTRSEELPRWPGLRPGESSRVGWGRPRDHGHAGRYLPTPTSRDHKGRNQRDDATCLTGALLPTPRTPSGGPDSSTTRPSGHKGTTNLEGALLPTPRTVNSKSTRAMTASAENGRRTGGGQSSPLGLEEVTSILVGHRPDHLPEDESLPPASRAVTALLPTPRAGDGEKGGPNRRGSSGDLMLPSAVTHLLPTPAVNDMGEGKTVEAWDAWTDRMKTEDGNGNGHGASLAIEAQRLLPTPTVNLGGDGGKQVERNSPGIDVVECHLPLWGQYVGAIHRWEIVTRPAPPPTEVGPKGNPRLSPRFSEWMMGLPGGWITDVPGVTRNEALKLAGNGVVPQQAEAALRFLLGVMTDAPQPVAPRVVDVDLLPTPQAHPDGSASNLERRAERVAAAKEKHGRIFGNTLEVAIAKLAAGDA